ncbi:MAG: TonB family protein [Rugosibacter sp.]|jgi:protein TonB|nr:periplasmic protein TonB [Rugosibacter sp.]
MKQQRILMWALGISLLLHAGLLAVRFKLPDALPKATERALDVILVNSKSRHKPDKAQARAQAALDGGGTLAEDRRAKTPLPPSPQTRTGDDLMAAQQRVAALEAQTQQLLSQVTRTRQAARPEMPKTPVLPAEPVLSGADLANHALAIARIEGEIAQRMEAYNQRPRKKFIGARVDEYRFAQYVEDWRQKVERVGNLNYPSAARGRLYGSLVLTAVIKSDGSLERVEVNRSSGQKVLDQAAARIVKLAAPYAAFPADISRDTDVIEITRTWTFTRQDELHGN